MKLNKIRAIRHLFVPNPNTMESPARKSNASFAHANENSLVIRMLVVLMYYKQRN